MHVLSKVADRLSVQKAKAKIKFHSKYDKTKAVSKPKGDLEFSNEDLRLKQEKEHKYRHHLFGR